MKRLLLGLLASCSCWAALAQQPLVMQAPSNPLSTPLTSAVSGTTSQITATLSGALNQWTYLCGFVITSNGTSPVVNGNVTVAGVPNQLLFEYDFVNTGQGLLGVAFPGCLTSSAQNTNISVTLPGSGGTGTNAAVSAWGYRN